MNCPKCGSQLSAGTELCPDCGTPVPENKKKHHVRNILIVVIALYFYWVLIDSIPNKAIAFAFGVGIPAILLIVFRRKSKITSERKEEVPETTVECSEENPPSFGLADVDAMEGHQFEYWSAEMLRNQGFQNVTVTPGSGDQGVDILAEKNGIRYAVQCKCYSSNLGNTPVQEVHAGKDMYHCHVGVVLTNRYFTEGARQLAEVTGTLLWDRDYILDYLSHNQSRSDYNGAEATDAFSEELIQKAIQVIQKTNQPSVSMLERKLGLGYAAAVRLMEQLEDRKIVGPGKNGKPRKILIKTSADTKKKNLPAVRIVCLTIAILAFAFLLAMVFGCLMD